MSMSESTNKKERNLTTISGKAILTIFLATALIYSIPSFVNSATHVASIAFFLGSAVLVCGYYHLVYVLPKVAKEAKMGIGEELESQVITWGARGSFSLIVLGFLIILLGLLNLMGIIPW